MQQPSVEEADTVDDDFGELALNDFQGKGSKKAKKSKSKPKPKSRPNAVSSAEVDMALSSMESEFAPDESDIQILMNCFFEDFNKIREYLQGCWCDYKEGLMSLTAVAITTNTAFDLFQRAEKELERQIPHGTVIQNFEKVTRELYPVDVSAKNNLYSAGWIQDWRIKIGMPKSISRPIRFVYSSTSNFDASSNTPPGKTPCIINTDKDYKLPNSYGTTPEDKMNRNAMVLSQFIAEMSLHRLTKMQGLEVPAEDSLQLGMNEMLESRMIPVWLVFACQVFSTYGTYWKKTQIAVIRNSSLKGSE